MAIHLQTLGGLRAHRDGAELDQLRSQRLRAALLVYLAIERRVSREHLSTVFWPESSSEKARHALRQSLYQLRRILGDDWVEVRSHELLAGDGVSTDVGAFIAALDSGDAEAAARSYSGPFLDGVHLADLKSWESWVDGKRAEYARAFQKASRGWVETRFAASDLEGATEAARRWAAADALDDEAQHRLIEVLAAAGDRAEAIRHYETYSRLLEAEDLQPLDETVELIERVRSGAAASVALQSSSERVPPAAAQRSRVRWSGGRVVAAAIMLLLVLWAVWKWNGRTTPAAPPFSSTAVAVFPFSVRGDDDAEFLRDAMASLLGTAMDGATLVRPVDARAIFAAVSREGAAAPDLDVGGRLAARLGAGLFVLGNVVAVGDQLQIDAVVYSARTPTEPLHRAAVSGERERLFDLVDRLAAQLLSGFGDPSADRLLRTAAVATSSLPSFKAYLEGEERMRTGEFERAADAYLQAIALDSTYAVAHYRLALAREWAPLPGNHRSAHDAARFASRLTPRDRALLEAYEAWRVGNAVEAERRYRAILARYPDDVEAWHQLGEIHFHFGYLLGRPIADSEEAWRQVLLHEPRNVFAVPHLARIAAAKGRVTAIDSLLAPFTPHELRTDRRLLEARLLRALGAGDAAETHSLVEELRRSEDLTAWRLGIWISVFSPDPAAVRPVLGALVQDNRRPRTRAALLWLSSVLHVASGQVVDARKLMALASAAEGETSDPARRWPFEIVTSMLAATLPLPYSDSALADLRRRTATAAFPPVSQIDVLNNDLDVGTSLQLEPLRQYTMGVLSLRLRDPVSAGVAAATLSRLAASPDANMFIRDLDRGLRARINLQTGRAEEALRLLDALEFGDAQGDVTTIPFIARANERFLRAEVLEALGRDREALTWLSSIGKGSIDELPFGAPVHLRQARIHERLGERGAAANHYAHFARLWAESDTEFQPVVRLARAKVAELDGSQGR